MPDSTNQKTGIDVNNYTTEDSSCAIDNSSASNNIQSKLYNQFIDLVNEPGNATLASFIGGEQAPGNNEARVPELRKESRDTPYLGENSMPAFIRRQAGSSSRSEEQSPGGRIEGAIMPMLGLQESSSSYPFLISFSETDDPI